MDYFAHLYINSVDFTCCENAVIGCKEFVAIPNTSFTTLNLDNEINETKV